MGKARRLGFWLVVALLPAQAGCLVLATGAAAGGLAAAGYAYQNGKLYRDYDAALADTLAATRTALTDLGFPIVEQKPETGGAVIVSRTADGATVRVFLEVVGSRIPAEGRVTRVGVRVGFSGDDLVSRRILDQVSNHLASPTAPQPGGAQPGATPLAPVPLAPAPAPLVETKAPPLAR